MNTDMNADRLNYWVNQGIYPRWIIDARYNRSEFPERLWTLISRLMEGKPSYAEVPLSRIEMAEILSVSPESVSRTLAGWVRDGKLRHRNTAKGKRYHLVSK